MGGDSTNDTSGGTSAIKLTTVTNPYANSTIRVLPSPPDESRPVAHAAEAAAIANASKVTKNNGTKHKPVVAAVYWYQRNHLLKRKEHLHCALTNEIKYKCVSCTEVKHKIYSSPLPAG